MFKQIENLHRIVETLDSRMLTCFALGCCERQFPIYARACDGQFWSNSTVLRGYLDTVWEEIGSANSLTLDAAIICADSAPVDPVETKIYAAADVAMSIAALIRYVVTGDISHVITIAEKSYDLINELVYALTDLEINTKNNILVDSHPLMMLETARQENDLLQLKTSEFDENTISLTRSRSVGVSIFEDEWYPDGY